jgi:hypothetical protein
MEWGGFLEKKQSLVRIFGKNIHMSASKLYSVKKLKTGSFNYTLNHTPKLYYSKHYDFIISLPFYPSLNKITTKKKLPLLCLES